MTIGDQILDLIIKDGLVRAQSVNGVLIFIWQGNAAEQLEALVEKRHHRKEDCDHIVKLRTALNEIAHPKTYGTTDTDPREIARKALMMGAVVLPTQDK